MNYPAFTTQGSTHPNMEEDTVVLSHVASGKLCYDFTRFLVFRI